MAKRVRLDTDKSPKLELKSNRVELSVAKERTHQTTQGRNAKFINQTMTVNRDVLKSLVEDHETMVKALKKHGVKIVLALHYTETAEWKKSMKEGFTDEDVPEFLKKDKPKETTKKKRKRIRG